MDKSKIRKGIIVITTHPTQSSNPKGSIVKTLAKPGEISDAAFKACGQKETLSMKDFILCEASPTATSKPVTCNNKPAFYEPINSLRLATELEKNKYAKGIRHLNDIVNRVTKVIETEINNNPW